MCDTCGCGQPPEAVTIRKPGEHHHHHDHDHHGHHHDHHDHDHHHHPGPGRTLQVETDILQENNLLAQRGIQLIPMRRIERYTHVIAGVAILGSGLAIRLLGL